jgi:hypothetical protein
MASPRITTVQIDDVIFNAESVSVGFTTSGTATGLPIMGSLHTSVEVTVDAHDTDNLPFQSLKTLFELSKLVTRDKVKTIVIKFWNDDGASDVICTFTFDGWINHFQIHSADGGNHTLVMSLQPTLDQQNYHVIDIGN